MSIKVVDQSETNNGIIVIEKSGKTLIDFLPGFTLTMQGNTLVAREI